MSFLVEISEEQIRKEREKARALRKSQWWKNRLAQGRCYYCGAEFAPADLTMDHIVPVIRGGRSTRGNCVPACKECNNRKKHLLPIEWEEYLDRLKNQG
ncbi:MAG: HNH endonuclease [Deltaproteobacteria bacterium]|nr:HNH endonuclease [Deltaproteobacteria bacterium]